MTFPITIPKYTSKDFPILVGSMLPMSVVLNYFLYGKSYFHNTGMLVFATLVTFIILGFAFLTYGFVAISLRNRFPYGRQTIKRMAICLTIFFLMSALYISLILTIYDNLRFYGYQYSEYDFTRTYFAFVVINIFLTFLNEGVYRFERYRTTILETEKLKRVHMHSQLLGLKSQMNPHFLFNSLNTLSSLINEDPDKAEDFLDHMSKVYRYLLRNNEEQLVLIETELAFIRSYFYLLRARYSEGLMIRIDVPHDVKQMMVPPLTLQMLIEHTMALNSLSRSNPLNISIYVENEMLVVQHNLQPKMNPTDNCCEVLDNISNKFKLICQKDIQIEKHGNQRFVYLPLIPCKEEITVA